MTLKRRIMIIFLSSSFVPFVCIALISYYAIYSILTNKIHAGIQSNLRQVELSLEGSINNLNHVSQQLAIGGSVGNNLDLLLSTNQPFQKSVIRDDIKRDLNLSLFANPNIGLTMYYFADDGTYDFESLPVKDHFSPKKLPLLAQYYMIDYYGPHISESRFDNQYVLSALRKVNLPERDDVYVYIESGFQLTQSILDNAQFGSGGIHLFLDNNGRIAYSDNQDVFKIDSYFPETAENVHSGTFKGYYWFREVSNQGWSVVSVIPKADYNREINRWLKEISLIALFFLVVSFVLAWLLWKMVYKPLTKFNGEMKRLTQSEAQFAPAAVIQTAATRIPEFDYLLYQFHEMKKQIWNLFREVEQKEKRRVDLEVEKLLYQINPHFLMNTLDTVHWLAVMNGQDEIDRLVSSLNKLLHYNLGKLGQVSTIREEIGALQEYLALQQVRYDFHFDVRIHVDEEVLQLKVPRFILQPLVENALYHGLRDDGCIQVDVRLEERIEISIRDNGAGMTEEAVRKLLDSGQVEHERVGMGIGMNYVKRMIDAQYGSRAELVIESAVGQGTTVFLRLPTDYEGGIRG
ncbi:sensor histidine kinase [Paenibacillus humicola]|uniref:sensor histidine kinase n=1 Tax=Paenibacillus humicola TaxID=3110540 RepID=UPI00237B3174|nr:sensor histidine kinase [Paenibacillus humicola]